MMPVAQEHAYVTLFLSRSINEPVYEVCTVLIVKDAVALGAEMQVSEHRCTFEKIGHNSILLIICGDRDRSGILAIDIGILAAP